MTDKEISDGSKLIAKIMGETMKIEFPSNQSAYPCIKKDDRWAQTKYHSSWNWLMPVIKKCYLLEAPTSEGWSKYERIQNKINENNFYFDDVAGVFSDVVTFITWYNNLKKSI